MRFNVVVSEPHPATGSHFHVKTVYGLTLVQARAVATHAARRGFKLFGGEIANQNWGARGGPFPSFYRSATIIPDNGRRKGRRGG